MVRAQVDLATATGLPSALALAPSPPSSPRHRAWDILGAWGARWLTPWRPRPLDCAQSLQVVLIGVAVFLIAWLGLALSHATGRIACIWLANGIVSATLLRRPASERAGLLGGALAVTTATVRHRSSSILRKLGGHGLQSNGVELPTYYDPQYECEMEILGFDSDCPNPKYKHWIQECQHRLGKVPVVLPETRCDRTDAKTRLLQNQSMN